MKPGMLDEIGDEIKHDLADRYFGFRKLIEEDKHDLEKQIRQQSFILEKRISFDLIRLYILLKDEKLIDQFLDMVSLDKLRFYDPFFAESITIRQRVFEGLRVRGLTRSGRFRHLVSDCYERLVLHTSQYREKFAQLQYSKDIISEEIELFTRKNDLGSIMGFLRSLNSATVKDSMEGGLEVGLSQSLEKKMAIPPPLSIEHYLPVIDPLPELDHIAKRLKKLTDQAYKLHDEESLEFLTSKKETARR